MIKHKSPCSLKEKPGSIEQGPVIPAQTRTPPPGFRIPAFAGMTKAANQIERRGFPATSQNDRAAGSLEDRIDYFCRVNNWLPPFVSFGINVAEKRADVKRSFLLEERAGK